MASTFNREICGFGKDKYLENKDKRDLRDCFYRQLITHSLTGYPRAFDVVTRLHWPHWFATILICRGNSNRKIADLDGRMMCMDAVFEIYRYRNRFRGRNEAGTPCRFITWAHYALRPTFARWTRREMIEQGYAEWPRQPKKSDMKYGDEATMWAVERVQQLVKVRELSDKLRTTFVLKDVRNLTYEEISSAMKGEHIKNLSWRVSVVRKQLV